jgi:hypothetical protein
MFIADSEGDAALTELQGAIADGFTDIEKVDALLGDSRLSVETKETIRTAADAIRQPEPESESDSGTESDTDTEA